MSSLPTCTSLSTVASNIGSHPITLMPSLFASAENEQAPQGQSRILLYCLKTRELSMPKKILGIQKKSYHKILHDLLSNYFAQNRFCFCHLMMECMPY